MTALPSHPVHLVRQWLSRTATTIVRGAGGVIRVLRTVTVRLTGYASTVLLGMRERHRERLAHDPGYRTAIATGLSALLVTVTPQPAVAAALAVLVSEHLGSPRVAAEQSSYGYDRDLDGYESYDARRAWSTSPSRPPQRLWHGASD